MRHLFLVLIVCAGLAAAARAEELGSTTSDLRAPQESTGDHTGGVRAMAARRVSAATHAQGSRGAASRRGAQTPASRGGSSGPARRISR